MTSHDVVDAVRRGVGIKKVGHAGTLDPMATGVLVICVGTATRLSEYIMGHTKSYRGVVRLGQTTDTDDAEGEVTAENDTPISQDQLEEVLPNFKGFLQQVPPMYSAIKQGGEKLYEKARRGEEVERPPREVAIYNVTLEDFTYPNATLFVRCTPGTYIRSLARDIGDQLGVGGHLASLRRLSSGENFTVDNAVSLDNLNAAFEDGSWAERYLLDVSLGLSQMPRIELNNQQEAVVRNGGFLELGVANLGLVQAWTDEGLFVGILARHNEDDHNPLWKPEKVFNVDA